MYCNWCGAEIKKGYRYCHNCGEPLDLEVSAEVNYPSKKLIEMVEEIAGIQETFSPADISLLNKRGLHVRSTVLPSGATEYVVLGTVVEYLIFVREQDGSRDVKKYLKAHWEDEIYEKLTLCRQLRAKHETGGYQNPELGSSRLANCQVSSIAARISISKFINTSGQGKTTVIPPEIRGWNWGAFFLNVIWGLSHRVWISLLCFIPFVGFIMVFVLGANGNECDLTPGNCTA